ncbi:MAG: RdgB/HAM1 family non-canonical purine NTP pyrophosphatase [Flavitalea sp.]
MTELIFATNNPHKVEEMQFAIGRHIKIVSLKDAGINKDIPEPHDTLEENAREKCIVIYELTGKNCFSEDTGLEVEALNGEPGVKSARYAGENGSAENNINKLLYELNNKPQKKARFRTVICLVIDNEEYLFEGICTGVIVPEKRGSLGFGYDPVFIPDGSDKTFAEMNPEEKNQFSHRQKAAAQLVLFLQERYSSL